MADLGWWLCGGESVTETFAGGAGVLLPVFPPPCPLIWMAGLGEKPGPPHGRACMHGLGAPPRPSLSSLHIQTLVLLLPAGEGGVSVYTSGPVLKRRFPFRRKSIGVGLGLSVRYRAAEQGAKVGRCPKGLWTKPTALSPVLQTGHRPTKNVCLPFGQLPGELGTAVLPAVGIP